jgi:hypothetical protein
MVQTDDNKNPIECDPVGGNWEGGDDVSMVINKFNPKKCILHLIIVIK